MLRARYGGFKELSLISGGYGSGETPVPIPNTEVKTASADGTKGEIPWESRSSPGLFEEGHRDRWPSSRRAMINWPRAIVLVECFIEVGYPWAAARQEKWQMRNDQQRER